MEPVILDDLQREWAEIAGLLSESGFAGFADFQDAVANASTTQSRQSQNPVNPDSDDPPEAAQARLQAFRQRLASVTVLDPACGSGNFLYVALRSLLDLERSVIDFAAVRGWSAIGGPPLVNPAQMMGLEVNEYAAQLAKTALWIGYIQWHQANGFEYANRPILNNIHGIECRDAAIAVNDDGAVVKAPWPDADYIIGNPPFLGAQDMLAELGC